MNPLMSSPTQSAFPTSLSGMPLSPTAAGQESFVLPPTSPLFGNSSGFPGTGIPDSPKWNPSWRTLVKYFESCLVCDIPGLSYLIRTDEILVEQYELGPGSTRVINRGETGRLGSRVHHYVIDVHGKAQNLTWELKAESHWGKKVNGYLMYLWSHEEIIGQTHTF